MAETVTFEKILDTDGILTYRTQGRSMEPMLHEMRDVVTLVRKTPQRCRKYDVVLYKRGGKYILHRVVEVREHDYVILGDNCCSYEYGITDDDILAVMAAFIRKGRSYSADDPRYLRYVRRMSALTPLAVRLRRANCRLRQIVKKIPGVTRLRAALSRRAS